MTMESSNCDHEPASVSASTSAREHSSSVPECVLHCALQQANSAQSLAASSCSCSTTSASTSASTSTCADFSSSEGGFDEFQADAAQADAAMEEAGAAGADTDTSDTSVSMLSLDFHEKSARGSQLSTMKASSALSLMPQQQLLQLSTSYRQRHHQPQKQRRRSNAISAKSRSSYLAQYNEAKCAYFEGVLAGDIQVVKQTATAPRFN